MNSTVGMKTFNFVIGAAGEERHFYVYPDIISKCSKPLAALMDNKRMEESLNGTAFLKEVDAETFALSADFACTGNYRCTIEPEVTTKQQSTPAMEEKATDESAAPKTVSHFCFPNLSSPGTYEIIKDHLTMKKERNSHCQH